MMTGRLGVSLADMGEDFEAVLAGQREVEQDEIIGSSVRVTVESVLTIGSRVDSVALERQ